MRSSWLLQSSFQRQGGRGFRWRIDLVEPRFERFTQVIRQYPVGFLGIRDDVKQPALRKLVGQILIEAESHGQDVDGLDV